MAYPTGIRPNARYLFFVLSIVAFLGGAASLALAFVPKGETERDAAVPPAGSERAALGATATPAPAVPAGPILVRGLLPRNDTGLTLATGEPADLAVTPTASSSGTAIRYWALVASPSAALPDLAAADRDALESGATLPEFASLGGLGGVPLRLAGPERPSGLAVAWANAEQAPTWDALLARLAKPGSGAIAVMPLSELDPRAAIVRVIGVSGAVEPAWIAERVEVEGLTPRGERAAAAVVRAIEVAKPVGVRIVATGDILLSRCTYTKIVAIGDWTAPFATTLGAFLRAADLTIGSLDGSIQDVNPVWGCVATTNLSSPPEAIQTLIAGGFDALTMATNHALDCGQAGCGFQALQRGIALLDAAGIRHTGGGDTLEAALAPVIVEVAGLRVGILGFDDIAAENFEATETEPGTAPLDDSYTDERDDLPREPAFYKPAEMLDLSRFTERIRALRTQVDLVIVQVQTGTENTHDPSPRSVKALRAAIEAGADLVVGNQAHWVQAVEHHPGAFLTYALGNFIFDQRHTPQHYQGVLLEAEVWGKKLVQVRLLPYEIIDLHRPEFLTGAARAKVLRESYSASARLPAP